jgi:hypothetical protein
MSEALRQLIEETQSKFKAEPESAVATFESQSALQEGLRSEVAVGEHKLVVDEPPQLGGGDAGPNPVEPPTAPTRQHSAFRSSGSR